MKPKTSIYLAACVSLLFTQALRADHITTLYANSAGTDGIQKFSIDVTTGTETQLAHYTEGGTQLNVGNGRGVVVVGNTMYYTQASSGSVYSYNLTTNMNNGVVFTVAGASGLATAAWDGSHLVLGDYSGTNKVYTYTTGGGLVSTVGLSKCAEVHQGGIAGFCDGLEFVSPSSLVSNEGDGGFGGASQYDVYSTAGGSPTQTGLITTSYGATGIAFDGTYYFVSDFAGDRIGIYDSTGVFQKFITLADGDHTHTIEDLSVDYNLVLGTVPEPSSAFLLLPVIGVLAFCLRKRVRVV
jgi:hypothetical protein